MGRNRAINLKDELLDMGISAEQILDYILGDYMSGVNAFQAMQEAMDELQLNYKENTFQSNMIYLA